ncbi:hypothetical protein BS78_01G316700 [Paspalum vaginatum]|nr:hypothetical protein BS78_01G316700 [Paspalum vaginatum]
MHLPPPEAGLAAATSPPEPRHLRRSARCPLPARGRAGRARTNGPPSRAQAASGPCSAGPPPRIGSMLAVLRRAASAGLRQPAVFHPPLRPPSLLRRHGTPAPRLPVWYPLTPPRCWPHGVLPTSRATGATARAAATEHWRLHWPTLGSLLPPRRAHAARHRHSRPPPVCSAGRCAGARLRFTTLGPLPSKIRSLPRRLPLQSPTSATRPVPLRCVLPTPPPRAPLGVPTTSPSTGVLCRMPC